MDAPLNSGFALPDVDHARPAPMSPPDAARGVPLNVGGVETPSSFRMHEFQATERRIKARFTASCHISLYGWHLGYPTVTLQFGFKAGIGDTRSAHFERKLIQRCWRQTSCTGKIEPSACKFHHDVSLTGAVQG